MKDRIVFYSADDLSCFQQLVSALPIIEGISSQMSVSGINDVIELFQIKLFVDHDIYHPDWSNEFIINLKIKIKQIDSLINSFFSQLNNENIVDEVRKVDFTYQNSFWQLFAAKGLYKRISPSIFSELLLLEEFIISEVLTIKKLSEVFGLEIKEFLLASPSSAELLLKAYEMANPSSKDVYHFPTCLTAEDKETIILNYLTYDQANINFVRLILNSGSDGNITISDRTRFKARELERSLNDQILTTGAITTFGCGVSIAPDQIDLIANSMKDNVKYYSYSETYLRTFSQKNALFWVFVKLFRYLDGYGRVTLVSRIIDLGLFDKLLIHAKREYLTGVEFKQKDFLSHLQLLAYEDFLSKLGSNVEDKISDFYNKEAKEMFGINGFIFRNSTSTSAFLEKIRMVSGEFDSILKQYNCYVEEGRIDHKYLSSLGNSIKMDKIPSLVKKKYFYGTGELFERLTYLLFSDQSRLLFKETNSQRFINIYDFLLKSKLNSETVSPHQKYALEYLISLGYFSIDSEGYILFSKLEEIEILRDLYYNEVSSYWRFSEDERSIIDNMQKCGTVYFESTLFSKPEISYFNFIMNRKKYSNGPNLRNSYVHGLSNENEDVNRNNYYYFMRLIILVTLKIQDDLFLQHYISSTGA